jgi:hypothetical protein
MPSLPSPRASAAFAWTERRRPRGALAINWQRKYGVAAPHARFSSSTVLEAGRAESTESTTPWRHDASRVQRPARSASPDARNAKVAIACAPDEHVATRGGEHVDAGQRATRPPELRQEQDMPGRPAPSCISRQQQGGATGLGAPGDFASGGCSSLFADPSVCATSRTGQSALRVTSSRSCRACRRRTLCLGSRRRSPRW